MRKRKNRESIAFAATVLTFLSLSAVLFLVPRLQDTEEIGSQDVDDSLYEGVEEYNRAIREIPGVGDIIVTAERNPDELTKEHRQIYLNYQRDFFKEWETAWTYYNAGYLDFDRWSIWHSWYIDEARRRPEFGWLENRRYFSAAFSHVVEDALRDQ